MKQNQKKSQKKSPNWKNFLRILTEIFVIVLIINSTLLLLFEVTDLKFLLTSTSFNFSQLIGGEASPENNGTGATENNVATSNTQPNAVAVDSENGNTATNNSNSANNSENPNVAGVPQIDDRTAAKTLESNSTQAVAGQAATQNSAQNSMSSGINANSPQDAQTTAKSGQFAGQNSLATQEPSKTTQPKNQDLSNTVLNFSFWAEIILILLTLISAIVLNFAKKREK